MKWIFASFLLVFAFLFTSTIQAFAGGWAVITLEEFPASIAIGNLTSIRFMVRQHGVTPLPGLDPKIRFENTQSGDAFTVTASTVAGEVGLYQAEFTIPDQGTWEWSIQAFTMDQRMPDLVVSEDNTPDIPTNSPTITPTSLLTIAGLILIAIAAATAILRRPRWAVATVVLGLVISGAGIASAMSQNANGNTQSAENSNSPEMLSSGKEGESLFVAKGCVTCHTNSDIDPKYIGFRSEIGPDLSHYAGTAEFLRLWLADPISVRKDAEMPNLELKEAEIESIITFLAEGGSPSIPTPKPTTTPEIVAKITPNPQGSKLVATQCVKKNLKDGLPVILSRDEESFLALLDPGTGLPVCQADKLDLGQNALLAFTQDRLNMAVLGYEKGQEEGWRLRWVDLPAWNIIDTGIVLQSWSQGIAIHPDNRQVVVAQPILSQEKEPRMLGHRLVLVDLKDENRRFETPLDIDPRIVQFIDDGRQILVYGSQYDYTQGTTTSQAILQAFETTDLTLDWETEISSVREGVVHTSQENRPDSYQQWFPALVFSPDNTRLFIIHADADRMTTVNLKARTMTTTDMQPRLGWLERFLWATARVAQAKGLNGTTKQASISSDGKTLFVTGMTGHVKENGAYNWDFESIPLGLQVIDIPEIKIIQQIKSSGNELSLAKDGATLYLRGWNGETAWTDFIDTKSLKIMAHIDRRHLFPIQSISGTEIIAGSPQGSRALRLEIWKDQEAMTTLNGNGYWISIP